MSKVILVCILFSTTILAASVEKGIEFARVEGRSLRLDLYLPEAAGSPPLIVWVHGGAWRQGNRDSVPIKNLVSRGWAIASVDYRLTPEATFPAQVHDIKAAIRFLRARGDQWRVNTDRIIIAGSSAGGHLAALVGVTHGHPELEGQVGQNLGESSAVQAIVSFFGASNLTTILTQSTPYGLNVRVPALDLLLGGHPEAVPHLARLASPVFHVDRADPPLLLLHGDQDPQMPINQSHELHGKYLETNRPVDFIVVYGAAHGGEGFFDSAQLDTVDRWLREQLGVPN